MRTDLRRPLGIDVSRTTERVPSRIRPRGVPPGLDAHREFHSRVILEAEYALAPVLGRHRIRIRGVDAGSFEAAWHVVHLRRLAFGYLDYGCAVELRLVSNAGAFLVMMPTSGSAHVEAGEASFEASTLVGYILGPESEVTLAWEADSPHLVVVVNAAALEERAAQLSCHSIRGSLRLDTRFDLTTGPAIRWQAAVSLLHAEIYHPTSLLNVGAGVACLEDFVMSSLLLAQKSNASHAIFGGDGRAEHRAVRRAVRYLEDHLAEPVTVEEVAEVAGVSVRTLQQAFRHDLGMSVTEWVREQRLQRVREDLVWSSRERSVSVSEIAAAWGFNHLGRFAAYYRRRFGENPSDTMRHA